MNVGELRMILENHDEWELVMVYGPDGTIYSVIGCRAIDDENDQSCTTWIEVDEF